MRGGAVARRTEAKLRSPKGASEGNCPTYSLCTHSGQTGSLAPAPGVRPGKLVPLPSEALALPRRLLPPAPPVGRTPGAISGLPSNHLTRCLPSAAPPPPRVPRGRRNGPGVEALALLCGCPTPSPEAAGVPGAPSAPRLGRGRSPQPSCVQGVCTGPELLGLLLSPGEATPDLLFLTMSFLFF